MTLWDEFLQRYLPDQLPDVVPAPPELQPVEHEIHEADGIYIRQIAAPAAGTRLDQHKHVWDHLTMVAAGSIAVWKDGVYDRVYRAPAAVMIRARVAHAFLTLSDGVVLYCIHAMRGDDKAAILAEHDLPLAD